MTDFSSLRIAAHRAQWRDIVEFFAVEERPVSDYHHTQPHLLQPTDDPMAMAWVRQKEGFSFAQPSFALKSQNAQELFEMLWAAGFRPQQQVNEAARIDAVQRHLDDMRTIAFDRLKVALPQR